MDISQGLLLPTWCLVDELAPHEQRAQPKIAHATEVGRRLTIKKAIELARIPQTAAVEICPALFHHRPKLW
jgi:hypothetical protein